MRADGLEAVTVQAEAVAREIDGAENAPPRCGLPRIVEKTSAHRPTAPYGSCRGMPPQKNTPRSSYPAAQQREPRYGSAT
jgi:hypothetical protein